MLVVAVINKSDKPNPILPGEFIGSMQGTMEITGDIISPIEVMWEADQGSDQDHPL